MRFIRVTSIAMASALSAAVNGQAADYTLTHKNSSVQVNITNANAGVVNWTVDGVNNLAEQRFYYRVGPGGPEALVQSISSSPAVSFTQIPNVLSVLDATYVNAGSYSVRTVFQLTGGNIGSGNSGLSETITVKNLSGSILDFHLFQYSDFNLYGLAGGQTAQFSFDNAGQPYKVTQSDGVHSVTETLNGSSAPVGHFEAALANVTLASLIDGAATTLSDNPLAGPGNATFAYQWDVALVPNGTLTISKLLSVPEPTSGVLILAALAMMALGNHRRRI